MKNIQTDPEAESELAEAADWYESKKEGLGAEFLDGVDEATVAIQRYPKAFPLFQDTSIRKYVMRRFPYIIFFEELDSVLWIYAFAHTKRKPGYWLKRVEKEDVPDD